MLQRLGMILGILDRKHHARLIDGIRYIPLDLHLSVFSTDEFSARPSSTVSVVVRTMCDWLCVPELQGSVTAIAKLPRRWRPSVTLSCNSVSSLPDRDPERFFFIVPRLNFLHGSFERLSGLYPNPETCLRRRSPSWTNPVSRLSTNGFM